MYQEIREKIPQINLKIDFEEGWSELSEIQVEMLKYVNGIASVEIILRVIDATLIEATDALMELVNKGWVFLGDEDLSNDFDELLEMDIPDDDIAGSQLKGDSFERLPDGMIDDSSKAPDYDALPSMLPETKGKITVSEKPSVLQNVQPVGKRIRMPAIAGEQLPKFLIKAFHNEEESSFRFFYGSNKSFVFDFFRGNIIRIVPRPINPKMFLGILLVKMAGMKKDFIARSIELVKKEGILQGEALLRLGALAPKSISDMLSYQAKWRIMQLLQSEKVGYRTYPGRIHRRPVMRLDWKPALFHTVWHYKTEEWLMQWAKENSNCTVEKVSINSTIEYGLGTETADFLQTGIISGSILSDYFQKQGLKAEISIRAVYAYFRMGLIRLVRANGKDLDADEVVESFDTIGTELPSSIVSAGRTMDKPAIEELRNEIKETKVPINSESSIEDEIDREEEEWPTEGIHEIPPPETSVEIEEEVDNKAEQASIQSETVREDLKERKRKQLEKMKKLRAAGLKKFNSGMEAFNNGNWKIAGRNFGAACKRDIENPLYPAYKAFCLFAHRKETDKARNYVMEIKNYSETGEDGTPDYAYLQGLIYKIAQETDKAILYFRKALLEDPDHLGSLREVRSYNLARQKEDEKQQGGLFARALGKKK